MIREMLANSTFREKLTIAEEILGGAALVAAIEVPDLTTSTTLLVGGGVVLADSVRRIVTPTFREILSQTPQEQQNPNPVDGP
jgi:hypothetical protein